MKLHNGWQGLPPNLKIIIAGSVGGLIFFCLMLIFRDTTWLPVITLLATIGWFVLMAVIGRYFWRQIKNWFT
jgi:CHASE2 domain-containing sensor protein